MKRYYISWVDLSTDPWPQWQRTLRQESFELEGRPVAYLPANHPQWPGMPYVLGVMPTVTTDARMGQYRWPGIGGFQYEAQPARLHAGATVTAFFHSKSPFNDLKSVSQVYLLYSKAHEADSPHQLLLKVLDDIYRMRVGGRGLGDRVRLVPIEGIENPTDHKQITEGVERWIDGTDDPLRRGNTREDKEININLSPGTESMHACWLMLRWKRKLGNQRTLVNYYQNDGGRAADEETRQPLKLVDISLLSQWVGKEQLPEARVPAEGDSIRLPELTRSVPYNALRQRIDQAAMLGLPILLEGERGSGKTFLAEYYHQRRKNYRRARPSGSPAPTAPAPGKKREQGNCYLPVRNSADSRHVTVTLSEFDSVSNLRDQLFGWAKDAHSRAEEAYDGLLGLAHQGTLFLDEIHHLDRSLQAALLGPLNNGRYRPLMADYELESHFDLVTATNDPRWQDKLTDDFRDRIVRIVVRVPSFKELQRDDIDTLWLFWEYTIKKRCRECNIPYTTTTEPPSVWEECSRALRDVLRNGPLRGNWRDLQRLADNVLLELTAHQDGAPGPLQWDAHLLQSALDETFGR